MNIIKNIKLASLHQKRDRHSKLWIYLDFPLLLSSLQSIYHFLITILLEGSKQRARKMISEFNHFYAALVKDLVRLKIEKRKS